MVRAIYYVALDEALPHAHDSLNISPHASDCAFTSHGKALDKVNTVIIIEGKYEN